LIPLAKGSRPNLHLLTPAAEFQKILDHRGIVGLDPIGQLAQVQLGRVSALSGDSASCDSAQ